MPLRDAGVPPARRFCFYDQVHTTGIDVKHRPDARAAGTCPSPRRKLCGATAQFYYDQTDGALNYVSFHGGAFNTFVQSLVKRPAALDSVLLGLKPAQRRR